MNPKRRSNTPNLLRPTGPMRVVSHFGVSDECRTEVAIANSIEVKGVRDRFWEIGNCPSIIDDVACILSKRRFLLRLTVRETGGKLLQFGGNYFTGGIDGSST